jgi:hypothetical protein
MKNDPAIKIISFSLEFSRTNSKFFFILPLNLSSYLIFSHPINDLLTY